MLALRTDISVDADRAVHWVAAELFAAAPRLVSTVQDGGSTSICSHFPPPSSGRDICALICARLL